MLSLTTLKLSFNFMKKILLAGVACILLFVSMTLHAVSPLPVAQAFELTSCVQDATHFSLSWKIAPQYHLYSDAFKIMVVDPQNVSLADWQLPNGTPAYDPERGHYVEYRQQLTVPLSLVNGTTAHLQVKVNYQGCADLGFCYPPQSQVLNIGPSEPVDTLEASNAVSKIGRILAHQSLLGVLSAFFGFGLLLAFTPCVFPMLPILSSIIIGHGSRLSTLKAFSLSFVYVLASAFTYAIAGAIAGLAGNRWQNALQNPFILGGFGLMMVVLALSLFGFYEVQLPHSWQQRLNRINHQQHGGSYFSALIMGVLATLIVSPCVSAPLVGALAYIGQTGSAWLGGSALLMLGLGMGLPLLLVGTSAGRWLPKAGAWMAQVKAVFGVGLLWLAISLWSRFLPETVSLGLWGIGSIVISVYLGAFEAAAYGWHRLWKALGIVLALYGACALIGALRGNGDPFNPLMAVNAASVTVVPSDSWQTVNSATALDNALTSAASQHKPVLVDFYADWCVSCHAMQREVFDVPQVQAALQTANLSLIRVDVTEQNADQLALQKTYGVVAPPTLVFIDRQGQVLTDRTLVGEQSAADFLTTIQSLPI